MASSERLRRRPPASALDVDRNAFTNADAAVGGAHDVDLSTVAPAAGAGSHAASDAGSGSIRECISGSGSWRYAAGGAGSSDGSESGGGGGGGLAYVPSPRVRPGSALAALMGSEAWGRMSAVARAALAAAMRGGAALGAAGESLSARAAAEVDAAAAAADALSDAAVRPATAGDKVVHSAIAGDAAGEGGEGTGSARAGAPVPLRGRCAAGSSPAGAGDAAAVPARLAGSRSTASAVCGRGGSDDVSGGGGGAGGGGSYGGGCDPGDPGASDADIDFDAATDGDERAPGGSDGGMHWRIGGGGGDGGGSVSDDSRIDGGGGPTGITTAPAVAAAATAPTAGESAKRGGDGRVGGRAGSRAPSVGSLGAVSVSAAAAVRSGRGASPTPRLGPTPAALPPAALPPAAAAAPAPRGGGAPPPEATTRCAAAAMSEWVPVSAAAGASVSSAPTAASAGAADAGPPAVARPTRAASVASDGRGERAAVGSWLSGEAPRRGRGPDDVAAARGAARGGSVASVASVPRSQYDEPSVASHSLHAVAPPPPPVGCAGESDGASALYDNAQSGGDDGGDSGSGDASAAVRVAAASRGASAAPRALSAHSHVRPLRRADGGAPAAPSDRRGAASPGRRARAGAAVARRRAERPTVSSAAKARVGARHVGAAPPPPPPPPAPYGGVDGARLVLPPPPALPPAACDGCRARDAHTAAVVDAFSEEAGVMIARWVTGCGVMCVWGGGGEGRLLPCRLTPPPRRHAQRVHDLEAVIDVRVLLRTAANAVRGPAHLREHTQGLRAQLREMGRSSLEAPAVSARGRVLADCCSTSAARTRAAAQALASVRARLNFSADGALSVPADEHGMVCRASPPLPATAAPAARGCPSCWRGRVTQVVSALRVAEEARARAEIACMQLSDARALGDAEAAAARSAAATAEASREEMRRRAVAAEHAASEAVRRGGGGGATPPTPGGEGAGGAGTGAGGGRSACVQARRVAQLERALAARGEEAAGAQARAAGAADELERLRRRVYGRARAGALHAAAARAGGPGGGAIARAEAAYAPPRPAGAGAARARQQAHGRAAPRRGT